MVQTPMRLHGEKEQADITFDAEELESHPLTPDLAELIENPSVDLMLSIAEKRLGHESPKLRELARECKLVIEGESRSDRRARIRYKRIELFDEVW